jgi:hypothetical protein
MRPWESFGDRGLRGIGGPVRWALVFGRVSRRSLNETGKLAENEGPAASLAVEIAALEVTAKLAFGILRHLVEDALWLRLWVWVVAPDRIAPRE